MIIRCLSATLVFALGTSAIAQEQITQQPLSVIDWLSTQPETDAALPDVSEPEVTGTGTVPAISVVPLREDAAQRVGLAPSRVTGLPDTLWSSTAGRDLSARLSDMPTLRLPALQTFYYTLLLAEAAPPLSDAGIFDLARIDALMTLGALDPALALIEQAGPTTSPKHFAQFFDMALLAGTEGGACSILANAPHLSPSQAHTVFCAARAGDWNSAVLIMGTARALDLISAETAAALERFLDPDLFEDEPVLSPPSQPDPLSFRVFQSIGTPIPTRVWPLVYANADLSDTAGWKAQIEAAERLARSGAVPDNRLLGLYTQRRPAASGGVWDRVASLQRFETALTTGSASAVAKTLPSTWRAMHNARLAVPFANLFAEDLSKIVLSGDTADIAFEVMLLSNQYERAAQVFPTRALRQPILAAVARGEVPSALQGTAVQNAVISGFRDAEPDPSIIETAKADALGLALFDAIHIVDAGSKGDVARLATGLATLRALGLEDVARRTALQVLLLGRRP